MGRRQYSIKIAPHLEEELQLMLKPNGNFETYADAIGHLLEQQMARRTNTKEMSDAMIEAMNSEEFQTALKAMIRKHLAVMFQTQNL